MFRSVRLHKTFNQNKIEKGGRREVLNKVEATSRVLVVSHCLLNKSTRWWCEGKPIERNMGLATKLIEFASNHSIGLIQLPCPEFTFCGNPRPPRTKDEYEALNGFIEHCKKLAKLSVEQIESLVSMSQKPRIEILAVVGVKRSPSCAVNSAPKKVNANKYVEEEGVFLGLLRREMQKRGLNTSFIEFDFDEPEKIEEEMARILGEE